jgi:hypothetical protein
MLKQNFQILRSLIQFLIWLKNFKKFSDSQYFLIDIQTLAKNIDKFELFLEIEHKY